MMTHEDLREEVSDDMLAARVARQERHTGKLEADPIADALKEGKSVQVNMSITGAQLKAGIEAAEARELERDRRQRRLLVALWNAAWWIQLDIECREEAYRNPESWEIETEPERTEIEEAWKSHAEYVAVLRENGVDPNKPIDQQLPEDAPLPDGYWRGAT
ncbi:MAG: hypothetical protein F4Y03_10240 [Alphaproteobacteria bacterium]|nr:hypothetical protein [Alphaproteobacteria bacterium]